MPAFGFIAKAYDVALPFYVLNSFIALPFFYLGWKSKGQVMKVLNRDFNSKRYTALLLSLAVFIVLSIGLLSMNGCGTIPGFGYGENVILFYLQGVIGSLIMLCFCRATSFISDYKPMRTLGGGTLVILLAQPAFILVFKTIYKRLMHVGHPAPYFPALDGLVAAVLIIALMYPLIWMIARYVPVLNGK